MHLLGLHIDFSFAATTQHWDPVQHPSDSTAAEPGHQARAAKNYDANATDGPTQQPPEMTSQIHFKTPPTWKNLPARAKHLSPRIRAQLFKPCSLTSFHLHPYPTLASPVYIPLVVFRVDVRSPFARVHFFFRVGVRPPFACRTLIPPTGLSL